MHFLQCTIKAAKKIFLLKISPIETNTDAIRVQVADFAKCFFLHERYYPFTLGTNKLECTHKLNYGTLTMNIIKVICLTTFSLFFYVT